MTSSLVYNKYRKLSAEKINHAFIDACHDGNLNEVRYLLTSTDLKNNANIHYYDDSGLSDACWHGHLHVAKYLLTSPELIEHANLNNHEEKNCGSLLNACGAGHFEIVQYLLTSPELKEHAFINASFMPPLDAACESGHFEIVKYLLTSPDIQEHAEISISSLVSAVSKDQLDILKYLLNTTNLQKNCNIHEHNDFLFKRAIYHESTMCMEYLIFDFNINLTDSINNYLNNPEKTKENFTEQIKKMFLAREINQSLEKELSSDKIIKKQPKL